MPHFSSFVVVVASSAALFVACSGSSAPSAPGAPAAASAPAASAAASPSAESSSARRASPGASASSAPAPGGGRSAPSATAAPTGPSTAAGQPVAAGVPLPPPGSYTYRLHGKSSSLLGDRDYNGESTLIVDQPQGAREHSEQRDSQGKTEQVVLAKADGLYLAEIHLTQPGFDEDFKPSRPALLFPADAHKGQHWQWHMTSTDGDYTLTAQLTVDDLHSSARMADGKRVDTVALSSVLHITSKDIDLTIHQHDEAGRDAVIVRERSVTDGTAYGTSLHSNGTRVLASRPS